MNPFRIALALSLMNLSQLSAQEADSAILIRSVYHNPISPVADLYVADKSGAMVKLNLVVEGLGAPQVARTINGTLQLFTQPTVDPKNPSASLAATCKVPEQIKQADLLIFPAPENAKPPYRVVLIDDAPNVFQKGQSRVINLTAVEIALQAGEHKLPLPSGKITEVPAVTKVNEYNMAQTNFYYKQADEWVAFTERQLQYLDTTRRIFLVHLTPGSTEPVVRTIVDTTPEVPVNKGK